MRAKNAGMRQAVQPTAPKQIGSSSPVEDLPVSVRARNALHTLGCNTVEDVLRLDLSGQVRGIGQKTKHEVLAALRSAGFEGRQSSAYSDAEITRLDRSLEKLHLRIDAALGSVSKEIKTLQKRLRKRVHDGREAPEEVTPV